MPGRYTITAEFPGFEVGRLQDLRLSAGSARHAVNASTRADSAFGVSLPADQIDALPDNLTEALEQLLELAGPSTACEGGTAAAGAGGSSAVGSTAPATECTTMNDSAKSRMHASGESQPFV